jgi:hypothetical protein
MSWTTLAARKPPLYAPPMPHVTAPVARSPGCGSLRSDQGIPRGGGSVFFWAKPHKRVDVADRTRREGPRDVDVFPREGAPRASIPRQRLAGEPQGLLASLALAGGATQRRVSRRRRNRTAGRLRRATGRPRRSAIAAGPALIVHPVDRFRR